MPPYEFYTADGKQMSIALDPMLKVGQVLAVLREEDVPAASYLVSGGRRVEEDACIGDVGRAAVLVGESVVSQRMASRADSEAAAWDGDGMKRWVQRQQTGVKCNPLTDEEMADVHRAMRWLLGAGDVLAVVEEVLQDKEELDKEDCDYEAHLETLCPVPEAKLATLTEMGFAADQARRALWLNRLDVQASLNCLLEYDAPIPPISKVQFRRVRREAAAAQSEPEFNTAESVVRATLHHLDSAMALLVENMRPLGSSRQPMLTRAVEDTLNACSVDSKLLRRAFQQLVQHPQSIFDYLSDPVLSPFFTRIVEQAKDHHEHPV